MASLYTQLIGEGMSRIGGGLHSFLSNPQEATGVISVKHHPGRMARFFVWLLRLPAEGTNLQSHIRVHQTPNREVWRRNIGSSRFRTVHTVRDGLLLEKAGLFQFRYVVKEQDGAMVYQQREVRLLGVRLPRTFSPIVDANAVADGPGWILRIVVSCPRCGPICTYEGRMVPE